MFAHSDPPICFQPAARRMVEPNLKVIVSAGAMRESYQANYIELQYDPAMDSHRLTEPMSGVMRDIWRRHNTAKPPEVLAQSDQIASVFTIIIAQQLKGSTLFVNIPDSGDGFRRDISLLQRHCGEIVAGREYEVLCAALAASTALPAFVYDAKQHPDTDVTSVVLMLERSLARETARNCDWAFDSLVQPYVYFADHELGGAA